MECLYSIVPSDNLPSPRLSIPIGVVCALLFGLLWTHPLLEQPTIAGYPLAVGLFALAALLELTAEPLWIMGQLQQYVTLKVGRII